MVPLQGRSFWDSSPPMGPPESPTRARKNQAAGRRKRRARKPRPGCCLLKARGSPEASWSGLTAQSGRASRAAESRRLCFAYSHPLIPRSDAGRLFPRLKQVNETDVNVESRTLSPHRRASYQMRDNRPERRLSTGQQGERRQPPQSRRRSRHRASWYASPRRNSVT